MFGVDVVYVFHVCVPCLVLMLCMCSMYEIHVCVPCLVLMLCMCSLYVFHVWC